MKNTIISGVYIIINNITDERYVGCSTNIHRRWKTHIQRSKSPTCREYNKKLYKAFREYGVENFTFEILEEVEDIETIYEREKFHINEQNSYENGYNENHKGSNHGRAKLIVEDVIDIRTRYANLETKRNVYEDYRYKISKTGFHKIWNGYTWTEIMMEVYTQENKKYHKNNTGSLAEKNHKTKMTNEEVLNIWERKRNGEKRQEVYKSFSEKLTFGSFTNIWYKCNWKSIA